jgi:FlaA1/EpsC-like NDP-sugar epimerase
MTQFFSVDDFIKQNITQRSNSFFEQDILKNFDTLTSEIKGKSALIIGGAGTIGSSFVKELLKFHPAKVIVVDINENALTELVRDLRSNANLTLPAEFITYPISFNEDVFYKIFNANAPFDIVANFAAHKHVRSEKDIFCIEAMINNNVVNAKKILDALITDKPKHFFCVSTDKAANPVNVMGASKKLMEDLIMNYSNELPIKTARFANVAFSNGSLLAGFIERIFKNQPLSCPADVKRFFVSPEESGQICLLACILGESGDIFFPKLTANEDLISFASIVPLFLKKFGYEVDVCATEQEAKDKAAAPNNSTAYPVYFFNSNTSGEKLFEEFYTSDETLDFDSYTSLGVIKKDVNKQNNNVATSILKIKKLFDAKEPVSKTQVVALLKEAIPSFNHLETGVNLDQKM